MRDSVWDEVSLLITNQSGLKNPQHINQKSNEFDNFFRKYVDNNTYQYLVSLDLFKFPNKNGEDENE